MSAGMAFAGDVSASDLAPRLRQQELVAGFGRFALRVDDMQAILDEASRIASVGLEAKFAKVLQYLPDRKAFLVRAGVGWKPGVVGHALLGDDSQSPAGHAFETGEPVVSNDLAVELRFRTPELLREHGVRSAINVLIAEDGNPFGVLEVDSTHRSDFGEPDVAFLQALGNTLAAAIRGQQREDARARTLREKEALLAENRGLLHEKDLLIREVHHRVTNSLQLVHSALSIQARTLANLKARQQVSEAAARVQAIAAVHRRLYQAGSVSSADASFYLHGLMEEMAPLVSVSAGRRVQLDVESIAVAADDLAHLGLIVVELVTNALKHGKGVVTVAVRGEGDALRIAVSDEGTGFPAAFQFESAQGLGLKIVSSLARSLKGDAIAVDRSVPFTRIVVKMALSAESPQAEPGL